MKDLIDWLMKMERISGRLYRNAAVYFKDAPFTEFLQDSANDEALHHSIIATAADIIATHPEIKADITVDQHTQDTIAASIIESQARLDDQSLTRETLIDCIVATEYSEWNDIFLYVVNLLKDANPDFKPAAANIQHHLRHIEHFLNADPYGRQKLEAFRKLQPIWTESALIIEDDPLISELLATVIQDEGRVDTAENGAVGLEKIRARYYRLVISDINMPVMDGMDLFQRARDEFPGIEDRFLFLTGNPTAQIKNFLEQNDVKYLFKPASIVALKKMALATMHDIHDH